MRILLSILLIVQSVISYGQANGKRMTRAEYIETYKDEAIKEMNRSGVPASITLAQGILESGDGNSQLAVKAKNHFGIKCHSDWKGKTFIQDDDEKDECFRKYNSVLESFHDHSEFLKRARYASLFELKITDYKGWARGLKKAGYATNPRYPELLIKIIEQNQLYNYDKAKQAIASKKSPKKNKSKKPKKERNKISKRKGHHTIKLHENNIKYISIKEGDSFEKIAEELNMGLWQLEKYNEWPDSQQLQTVDYLFLQPKRRKAKSDNHIVEHGESLWDISHRYGIKLKKLEKLNGINRLDALQTGQKVKLNK